MKNIPIVQSGIKDSLLRSYHDSPDGYLLNWWMIFKAEQPTLAQGAMEELKSFTTAKEAAAFSHGIWLVYSSLKSQEEANEMNRAWGD